MAYPSSIDSFTHKVNNFDTFMAEDVNELQDAIEAIEAELGTTPKGSSADVAARFAALDTLLGSNPQSIYADLAARLAGYDSGWINLPTCTYVSATSFTLAGDWTAKLKLGVFWSGYNGSQKYGYVLSSTYSAGTGLTTVNLVANTSYSLANATITGSKFAYSPPPDFPGWLSYTPIWTAYSGSPTIGDGSLTGAFSISNHVLTAHISAVFGATTNFASSQIWYFSLPVQPIIATLCSANGEQSGGTKWILQARTETSTSKIVAGMMNNSAGWVQYNTPFTWASGDKYTADIVCRI